MRSTIWMTEDVAKSRMSTEVKSWKSRKLVPALSQPPVRVLRWVGRGGWAGWVAGEDGRGGWQV